MPILKGQMIEDQKFGYEVDFLAVGEGERSGDAIALRWGDLTGPRERQYVMVVDGGTKDSGREIVNLIKTRYGTAVVDAVVLTHPDQDHASGLTEVLSQLHARYLWMQCPWDYSSEILAIVQDGRVTRQGLRDRWQTEFKYAHELSQLAKRQSTILETPFAGSSGFDNGVACLHPSAADYKLLLANFEETPEVHPAYQIGEQKTAGVKAETRWVREDRSIETLVDPGAGHTTFVNESSLVFMLKLNGHRLLFTGDVGRIGMLAAIRNAGHLGEQIARPTLTQIPHHGSKHNIGPAALNGLFGKPAVPANDSPVVFISAARDGDPKHPSRKVLNALKRRNVRAFVTAGRPLWHYRNAPPRADYAALEPVPFHDVVEDYSE